MFDILRCGTFRRSKDHRSSKALWLTLSDISSLIPISSLLKIIQKSTAINVELRQRNRRLLFIFAGNRRIDMGLLAEVLGILTYLRLQILIAYGCYRQGTGHQKQ